jgi:DNA methyltransferase 1-associated protein 1
MASTSDIRDIMNLGQAGPRQPAPKKKKHAENAARMSGFTREIQALMGDSVPPIAIVEQRSYKSRPSISQKLFKARHWEERPFQHGARTDGLVLRHWKRSIPGTTNATRTTSVAPDMAESPDVEMLDESKTTPAAAPETRFEEEFPSHKWNVKVQVPSYTDEQYENLLKAPDWTRQETDHLMDLCREYDLRWVIIADRYDPADIASLDAAPQDGETATGTELVPKRTYPPRSMEALKQRYYAIAARILETQIPASNMTQAEFQLWEKMRSFDAKTETMRKAMAEKLFERTKDEADEERTLLEELHRITKNEDDFLKMRLDLYARLEPVTPIRKVERGEEQSAAMYQSSAGLSVLLQTLVAKEKRMKRSAVPEGADNGAASATPTDAQRWEKGRHPNQYTRRDTMDTQPEEQLPTPQKKGSTSHHQPTIRILTPQDEARFGVSHPQERLTSGVHFRHEKINRLTMAKSQTQTTKIQAALTELGIPPRLLMPTERVCREFERLITEINVLLDARKVNEKLAGEIKVLEEARRLRLGLPKEEEAARPAGDAMDVDSSVVVPEADQTHDNSLAVAEEDRDAEGEDDGPAEKKDNTTADADPKIEDSTMNLDGQADEDDHDAEGEDDDDDDDEAGTAQGAVSKPVKNEDEEEEEEEESSEEADEDEEKEDGNRSVGVDNEDEEDDDDDGEEEDDRRPGPEVDADSDEEEDEEEEIAATPQVDSDEEEEDEDDEEVEAKAEAESEEEEDEEDEDEDDGDEARQEGKNAADDSEDVAAESEQDDSEEAEEGGEGKAEDEPEEPPAAAAPVSAAVSRMHKRSASVISEASRAGSNRSGLGRKKRR